MRVLALSDEPSQALWGPGVEEKLRDIDLILSCGDLNPLYLSYLVTFTDAPLFYVHGNHDVRYKEVPPEGCIPVDGQLVEYQGVRILGLGGCMRYNRESPYQFTQKQMQLRAARLVPAIHRAGGFDILLTHAPAKGLGDGSDLAHTGFTAFRGLLDKYKPRYFVHGHVHLNYSHKLQRLTHYGDTQIINAFEKYVFDIPH